ncbi:hypothetical protein [Streptomyces sp. CB01881]|uniref:hypothetical protein n=1 Tax=Streptomyces sp. CB01881 TaxID=2078691 RepID=UPI000CDC6AE9|nr:hypothetical protein [Streptomyces sp. CB01881]AUY53759.1 hypothetical protein C2142_38605 [Streptomyces sp. CB01881]TYC68769.1 hypothetical protein EH183_38600 [Streptomyces sp. CB01881]
MVPDRGRPPRAALLPAGAKLSAPRPEREGSAAVFSEHALDVAAVAGLLAKGGIGHLVAFSTEVEHALPGRRSLGDARRRVKTACSWAGSRGAVKGRYRRSETGLAQRCGRACWSP